MTSKLLPDSHGLVRFLDVAKSHLVKWHSIEGGGDADLIAKRSRKEWDAMCISERRPFRRSTSTTCSPKEEFVINRRSELHQIYRPRQLNILEFIIKTKPEKPLSARRWFSRDQERRGLSSVTTERWDSLNKRQRIPFETRSFLDQKRYALEREAFITNMIKIDLDSDEYELEDFDIGHIRQIIDSQGSIEELSDSLPASVTLRRPRSPFSLFIEAYQYQIREFRPKFQFGQHLRDCSAAWNRLSDEEKQFYVDESDKLKDKRRKLLEDEALASESKLTVPAGVFEPDIKKYGPCRVSHLYPKMPPIHLFWASKQDFIDKSTSVKSQWDALGAKEKERFLTEYDQLETETYLRKQEIDDRHKTVKAFINDARELKTLKRKLKLIDDEE